MNRGEVYIPYMVSEYSIFVEFVGPCSIVREFFINLEFGKYRIVVFKKDSDGVVYRDIFRVSDGKDLYLGTCSKEPPPFEPFLFEMPPIYVEPTARAEIIKKVDMFKYIHLSNDVLKYITRLFVSASEIELEEHFNSLVFV